MSTRFPRIASLRTAANLRARAAELDIELPCDDELESGDTAPLAQSLALGPGPQQELRPTNRFVIQPMEGWDGTRDGKPSELTERRWRNFGASGAGWIWGGEAVAVREDGRANPNQLVCNQANAASLGKLRGALLQAAKDADAPAPVVGLQLTHSGRWSRPDPDAKRPRVAYRHPVLDRRVGVQDDAAVLSDAEVEQLIADYASAARLALEEGFDFVDLKHCHGYLLHEFLSAHHRAGNYGGATLSSRMRLATELIEAVRAAAPTLRIGVRLSLIDTLPYRTSPNAQGVPEAYSVPYPYAFGADPADPARIELREPIELVKRLHSLGVEWINVTAASPYYNPHWQRPAAFPPSDGYLPPEDPLVGVARLLGAARALKRAVPEVVVVASGWTYLQDFLPHVAQACLREGWFDAIGLGRMVLSYPRLPADVLAGQPLQRKRICRTFSDCTTAPRNGLISGCYPLDPFYRERSEREVLENTKRSLRKAAS